MVEWLNILQDSPEAEIREVADDPTAPVNKRTAARRWLAAVRKAGERSSRDAASFVLDYTDGRPRQSIEQHVTTDTAEARRAVDISRLTASEQEVLWSLLQAAAPEDPTIEPAKRIESTVLP